MIPVIAVTGTKGKTSVVRALDAVLMAQKMTVLRVDTEGAWLNGNQQYSHNDSKRIWGLAPANAPGRFMTLLGADTTNSVAVLEANLFCSKQCGLGYSTHKVGVFTNVYDDHKGADAKLQSRQDIARAKNFIFSRIADGGYAVFNADDGHVVEQLDVLPKKKQTTRVACSIKRSQVPADVRVFIKDDAVVVETDQKTISCGKVSDYALSVAGFLPSTYNVVLTIGALYGHFDGEIPTSAIKQLQQYAPKDSDGRLCLYQTRDKKTVIFDYAHETVSLRHIASLARQMSPEGRVIGLLRLSPTRTKDLINETAQAIAADYDAFYIYDKIDGVHRQPDASLNPFKPEVVGKTAVAFAKSLKQVGAEDVHMVTREDEAAAKAAAALQSGDVLVYIQGNSPQRSLDILHRLFGEDNLQRITS